MDDKKKQINISGSLQRENDFRQIVTAKHLSVVALIGICIILGLGLSIVPPKMQIVLILTVPAIAFVFLIIKNPYFGIYMYFMYDFLRPPDFIPALRPMRLGIVIGVSTLIAWILYLIKTRHKIEWDKFNYLYLSFLVIIATTIVTATNNRFAFDMFQVMVTNFIIFLIATNVVDSAKRLNRIIWLLLLIHLYFALYGIYNFTIVEFVRAGQQTSGVVGAGFIGDENDFAMALIVMIPFAYFLYFYFQSRAKKLFLLLLMTVFILGVVASASRGGMVGLAAVFIFILLKSKQKLKSLIVVFLLGLVMVVFAPSEYWEDAQSITDIDDATAQSRFDYWRAALRMVEDYPFTGVGINNGPLRMPEYYKGSLDPSTRWGKTFHGTLPQVVAELGIIGITIYLLMICLAILYLFRIQKEDDQTDDNYCSLMANAIMGSLVGYIATATFLSTAWYPQLWLLYTFLIIMVFLKKKKQLQPDVEPISLRNMPM